MSLLQVPGVDTLEKIGIALLLGVAFFSTGFVKGCSYEQNKQKEAEVKFQTITKTITSVEEKQVPVYITKVKTVDKIITEYVKEAHEDKSVPDPISCDLSPSRVQRINKAATSYTD